MKKMKNAVRLLMLLVFILSMIGCRKEDDIQESIVESAKTLMQTQEELDDETNEHMILETDEIKESKDSTEAETILETVEETQIKNEPESETKTTVSTGVTHKETSKDKSESRPQPVIKETVGESEDNMQITESEPLESQPMETKHTHVWQEIVETIHHDAVIDHVWVEDSPAWDEDVFSSQVVCGCGSIFESVLGWEQHSIDGCMYGYSVQQVKIGTIHHEAQGHDETIIISEAYDETVVTGYQCACGVVQ